MLCISSWPFSFYSCLFPESFSSNILNKHNWRTLLCTSFWKLAISGSVEIFYITCASLLFASPFFIHLLIFGYCLTFSCVYDTYKLVVWLLFCMLMLASILLISFTVLCIWFFFGWKEIPCVFAKGASSLLTNVCVTASFCAFVAVLFRFLLPFSSSLLFSLLVLVVIRTISLLLVPDFKKRKELTLGNIVLVQEIFYL